MGMVKSYKDTIGKNNVAWINKIFKVPGTKKTSKLVEKENEMIENVVYYKFTLMPISHNIKNKFLNN